LRAEEAERRSAWLAEASRALGESLEYGTTLRRLAHLAVRHLADWCVIDIVEDKDIRRVAGVHSRPAKQPLLEELRRRYPPRFGSPHPAASVLTSGEPLLVPELTEARTRALCVDDEHARLVRELGANSALSIPLIARDAVLGAITFVAARPGRYGLADLALGQELARRAAIAIDNARLYRESQEAVRLRDEFLSIASHELRTPIHSLQLVVQGLTRGIVPPTPERTLRAFAMAERQIQRLTRLIDELLEVSRIQAGHLTLQLEQVDLMAVVGDVVQQFETELAKAHCSLSVRTGPAVVGCWDRGKLEQVVANLLSNAIKFGAGKPIEVTVEAATPRIARLVVTDHGIGIPPERLSTIFGRFERAVSAREYGGLGLGLYIVRSIVEALGGSVKVTSTPGAGSTFTVELLDAGGSAGRGLALAQPSIPSPSTTA
jgi:signal transduction histidine kinase